MFIVLDGVINTKHFDVDVTAGVINSGIEGLWVSPTSVSGATVYDYVANPVVAFAILTESNKDGSVGFSQDAINLSKVAVLEGKYRAKTDQYQGTPAVNTRLKVASNGQLVTAGGSDNAVAIVLKAQYADTYMNTAFNVIEIQTL